MEIYGRGAENFQPQVVEDLGQGPRWPEQLGRRKTLRAALSMFLRTPKSVYLG